MNDQSDKFTNLERWLLENGASFPKLYLKDYGNEVRGCHTLQEIENDEVVVDIPLKCLITVEMGKATDIGKLIIEKNLELDAPKHVFLMLFMLIDRLNPTSFFKPYYDILPPTLHNMPIFWNESELQWLEGSYILQQIIERNEAILADYEAICTIAPSFKTICTLNEFKWARMCVCSRNFGLVVNGITTAVLVPYADMLNHYRPRETKWQFEDTTQSFRVISLHPITSGSQLYDSYGMKCNHRFLLNYGFSVENNVEADGFCPNEVHFDIELKQEPTVQSSTLYIESDELYSIGGVDLYEHKLAFWQRECVSLTRSVRVCISDNDKTKLLFSLIRIIKADEIDYYRLISSRGDRREGLYKSMKNAALPISIRNEIATLRALKLLCTTMLSKYKTTLDEDNLKLHPNNLNKLPLYTNERNAVIHVRGEKVVLHHYITLAECGLKLLYIPEENDDEYKATLKNIGINEHPLIFQYCKNIAGNIRNQEYMKKERLQRNLDLTRPTIV